MSIKLAYKIKLSHTTVFRWFTKFNSLLDEEYTGSAFSSKILENALDSTKNLNQWQLFNKSNDIEGT